jgi:hypothetical protein
VKAGALTAFVLAVAAVAVVVGLGSSSSDADSSPTAAHRALAKAQAARLLRGARVPQGASVVTTSVAGVQVPSLRQIVLASAPDVSFSTRTWSVPGDASGVAAFLRAHPVPGTHLSHGAAPASEVEFDADRLPPGVSAARIVFVLGRGGPHTTTVTASAQATWVVARPASETVPAGAHVVDVVRGQPGRRPGIALKVTDPQLTAIRKLIDGLPAAQPGVTSCPQQITGLPRVTFIFRTHEGGKVLAVASEDADVVEPTSACDPLQFSIGGRPRTPLLHGAALLRQVSAIVHHRLWLPPYAA